MRAALAALDQAYELNNDDIVNRLNAIQHRESRDKEGILKILVYLDGLKLGQRDSADLAEIKRELVKDGVFLPPVN